MHEFSGPTVKYSALFIIFQNSEVYLSGKKSKVLNFYLSFLFRGCNNVVGLKSVIRNGPESVLVMPYYRHNKFAVSSQNYH